MTEPQRFDRWYADMADSPRQARLQQQPLGLPPYLDSSSLLPWDGIADVTAELALAPGAALADLACGRGGYGLEIARRAGARLTGIDFSRVAIERARARHRADWSDVVAEFEVGELAATGMPDGHVASAMCIDAIAFADSVPAALAECRRILCPGGRLVLTGWHAHDPDDPAVPDRYRRDLAADLTEAGFTEVSVREMPAWRSAELELWTTAAHVDPAGDAAVESLHNEGVRILGWLERTRRILATAQRP